MIYDQYRNYLDRNKFEICRNMVDKMEEMKYEYDNQKNMKWKILEKNYKIWDSNSVFTWMKYILSEFKNIDWNLVKSGIISNDVNGVTLDNLTSIDLKELGFKKMLVRMRLMAHIKTIKHHKIDLF